FSSRRRHTRFSRDWSSDVCSSDLEPPGPPSLRPRGKGDCLMAVAEEALREAGRPKQKVDFLSGNEMAAVAARQINFHVMGYYPKIGRASCRERGETLGCTAAL